MARVRTVMSHSFMKKFKIPKRGRVQMTRRGRVKFTTRGKR